jgi:hypothetical protein
MLAVENVTIDAGAASGDTLGVRCEPTADKN